MRRAGAIRVREPADGVTRVDEEVLVEPAAPVSQLLGCGKGYRKHLVDGGRLEQTARVGEIEDRQNFGNLITDDRQIDRAIRVGLGRHLAVECKIT